MPRPKTKTLATSLKLTPHLRAAWEAAAQSEQRTLSNMFEVLVLDYCKRHRIAVPKPKEDKPK